MAGKKGALHSGWEDQAYVKECKDAYQKFQGNCRRAAKHLSMTPQQLSWVWKRAGLKPSGTSWLPIDKNPALESKLIEHGNVSRAALEVGINRNRAIRIINKYGYCKR